MYPKGFVTKQLDDDDIEQRIKEIESFGAYAHYRPLSDAADEFIRWAETPQTRVFTGLKAFDEAMKGTAPGEMTLIQGFTHSGKTLLATELLANNPNKGIILFTPDETRPLVLLKLTTATQGVSATELERRIQADDATARQTLLATAEQYARLAIFDEAVSLADMSKMLDETTHAMGQPPEAFMFDYADLLVGFDDVRLAITALKQWGKAHGLPGFVLHQASRTSGSSGRKMAIDSGAYGGEQQSTHVIGVRRKKYQHIAALADIEERISLSVNPQSIEKLEDKKRQVEAQLPLDENTITISLVKNKRPPGILVDDQDYVIDTETGRLSAFEDMQRADGTTIRVRKADLKYIRPEKSAWEERVLL